MNICIFSYCCAIIIPLLAFHTHGFSYEPDLYEGSPCVHELGMVGVCTKIPDCPARLREALQGKRSGNALGRCRFDGFLEIVCCANEIDKKFNVRPAELACQEFENEVENEIESEDVYDEIETTTITSRAGDGQRVNPFILAGTRAAAGEFPYMAALGYDNTDGELPDPIVYDCGGALISSKFILTAAHCVSNINNRVPKWARVGSVDIRSPGAQEIPLKDIIPHPKYRRSRNYNDIALVTLQTSLRSSGIVRPICLQTRRMPTSDNIDSETSFMVIGFGGTETDDRSQKLLKSANLNLVPPAICNASYPISSKLPNGIDDTLICAVDSNSTRGSDACQGDSGGPLLMVTGKVHMVIGVTSFGQGCGSVAPGGYTSVHSYIDWIESKVWPDRPKS